MWKPRLEAMQDGVRRCDEAGLMSLRNEVGRLGKLVDDLYQLSLSDLGALDYHKVQVALCCLVEQVVTGCRTRFVAAGLTLSFECEEYEVGLVADPARLTQLLQNLLENSMRYTDEGGTVLVRCGRLDGQVFLDVHDSAPGVSSDALPLLFDRLYREETSRNRARGGAGLGLAIARNIVDAHQGVITARHSPLGGLWIRVRIPSPAEDRM